MKLNAIWFLIICLAGSCGIYGYSSDAFNESYTVSIGNFKNNVLTQDPTIHYKIKEKLENKFKQDCHWHIVDNKGVVSIVGSVVNYQVEPISIGVNNVVYRNRVTMEMQIQFINGYQDSKKNDEKITEFVDYNASENLGSLRDSIHEILSQKIAELVYSRITNSW